MTSWTPPANITDVTGYQIFYVDGTGEEFVDVTGSGMSMATISNLATGSTYSITIVATSDGIPSEVVGPEMVVLGMRCLFMMLLFFSVINLLALPR